MSLLLALTASGGGTSYADNLSAGYYVISGNALTDAVSRADNLSAGAYSIAGNALTDTVARADSLSAGAYSIVGNDLTDSYVPAGGSSYADNLSAGAYFIVGKSITDSVIRVSIDGGGGKTYRSYWQPYLMRPKEWEEKIPAEAAKVIEKVAKSSKKLDAAEIELKSQIANYDDFYGDILRLLRQTELATVKALKAYQIRQIQKIKDEEENDEILLLLG